MIDNTPVANMKFLLKLDFIGASLTVIRCSTNAALVSYSGCVVLESKNTFRMSDSNGRLCTVPKIGTHFILTYRTNAKEFPLVILGSQLCYKVHERSFRKFKSADGADVDLEFLLYDLL